MKRKSGACCSGCLFLLLVLLLTDSWLGSSWPLRAVELLTGVVVVAALGYGQLRVSRGSRTARC
jgi:hypothetical protein